MRRISITLYADGMSVLFPMLQHGITIRTEVGCTLETFLAAVFNVTTGYVNRRMQIVLLDGKAVDRLDSAIIMDGATLALSSAMPGLAGAILRSGGHLAPLRKGITHEGTAIESSPHRGTVSIKLFNILIKELGFPLLENGICVRGSYLKTILENLSKHLAESCTGVAVDGCRITVKTLLDVKWLHEMAEEATWFLRIGQDAKTN